MRLFKCDFGGGVTCEVQIHDKFEDAVNSHIQGHAWEGNPTKKHIRPYVAWMNSVNQQLADEWGKTLCHTYQVEKGLWEMWVFKPGSRPLMSERFRC